MLRAELGRKAWQPIKLSTATFNVPAHELVRICADSVTSTTEGWNNFVFVNFTASSAYAEMDLPLGVKAEGFVVWNGGTSWDPTAEKETLPLRFSTDPATVFLPSVLGE